MNREAGAKQWEINEFRLKSDVQFLLVHRKLPKRHHSVFFLHLQNQMFSQNLNVFSLFSSLIDSLLVPCLGGTNPAFPYPPPHKLALTGLFAILPISTNRQPIFDKYSIFGIYNTIVLFQSSTTFKRYELERKESEFCYHILKRIINC